MNQRPARPQVPIVTFESSLIMALHEIAKQVELLTYDVENLTRSTQEIADTLKAKE